MTDQEVCCTFMEPRPGPSFERSTIWWKRHLRGARGHAWPRELDLDACHEIEARLTEPQRLDCRDALVDPYRNQPEMLWWVLFHATAEQKIRALAVVLRPIVEATK